MNSPIPDKTKLLAIRAQLRQRTCSTPLTDSTIVYETPPPPPPAPPTEPAPTEPPAPDVPVPDRLFM